MPQIPLLIYELVPGLCRSCFMTLRGKVFIGPPSSSSGCFHHDCRDDAWMNRTRMITRLHFASAPFIPPMWLLMIFRAEHYMRPAFPRMYCKSRGKTPFEVLRRTQVDAAASCSLNISSCNVTKGLNDAKAVWKCLLIYHHWSAGIIQEKRIIINDYWSPASH